MKIYLIKAPAGSDYSKQLFEAIAPLKMKFYGERQYRSPETKRYRLPRKRPVSRLFRSV